MKTFIRMAGLMLVAALFTANAWAQTTQLSGRLLDSDQSGIPGISVLLERIDPGGINVYEIETDERGSFNHLGIATGSYQISFVRDDTLYSTASRLSAGPVEVTLDVEALEYSAVEFSQLLGAPELVVREIRTSSAGDIVIAAPRNEDEAAARENAVANAAAVRAAFEAGRAAMEVENYPEAIAQFSTAASGESTQHVIFANLGLAYERSEMWEEAAGAYDDAQFMLDFMEEPPEGVNYYSALTLSNAMMGNVDRALENAEKGALVDPAGAAQSFYNIGAVLTNQGDVAGADQAFARAIEVNPEFADAFFQLAVGKLNSEATIPDAVPLLERYLELEPEGANAAAALGLLEFARQ